jgi:hypothetical protein
VTAYTAKPIKAGRFRERVKKLATSLAKKLYASNLPGVCQAVGWRKRQEIEPVSAHPSDKSPIQVSAFG